MSTTIGLGPLYQIAQPYLADLFVAVCMAMFGIVWQYLRARIKILQTQQAADIESKAYGVLQSTLFNAAGRYLAGKEGDVSSIKVDVHSPGIAAEVATVQQLIPGTLDKLGITSATVQTVIANGIVGKFGQLQAQATTSTVIGPVVVPSSTGVPQ